MKNSWLIATSGLWPTDSLLKDKATIFGLNPQDFAAQLQQLPPAKHFHIALSGGADSVALLLLFCSLPAAERPSFSAVHVNHQIHSQASHWAQFCRELCARLDVPCTVLPVSVTTVGGTSLEMAARDARYKALELLVKAGEAVVTAHHQDDQAETFLLNLMRGSGAEGLSAMPAARGFSLGWLLRPLLNHRRQSLLDYLQAAGQDWIEDDSNADTQFDRNFLRHDILPKMQQRWPAAIKSISKSASLQTELRDVQSQLAERDWSLVRRASNDSLNIEGLFALSRARAVNCIRYWVNLRCDGLRLSSRLSRELFSSLLTAAEDTQPCVILSGGNYAFYRYAGQLYLESHGEVPLLDVPWTLSEPLVIPQLGWHLSAEVVLNACPTLTLETCLRVKTRVGGERFRWHANGPSKRLKKCFQEWGVEPWRRASIPLIYHNDQLLIVWGYAVVKT